MPKLNVIVVSTRPQRAGLSIGNWFLERARSHGKFEVELVDLKEVNLPFLDEPKHPRFGQYQHAHTRAWSASVKAADAFVFVTPEYNYCVPATLVNALDFLYTEWNYKAAGFVSYGGASGGMRSVQMAKMLLTTLKMVPIPEAVTVPFFSKMIDASGAFSGSEELEKAGVAMLDELLKWSSVLSALRG
jgi:NAD(P)H-dependent FMN reductase